MKFKRRIGPDPHEGGRETEGCHGCPDIWELENGDFAVIGFPMGEPKLPESAGCGPDETVIRIPRRLLVEAKSDIPEA